VGLCCSYGNTLEDNRPEPLNHELLAPENAKNSKLTPEDVGRMDEQTMCHKRRQFVSIWRIAVESSARLTKCTGTAHATLAADARFLIDVFLEPRGSFVQCLSTADILVTAG